MVTEEQRKAARLAAGYIGPFSKSAKKFKERNNRRSHEWGPGTRPPIWARIINEIYAKNRSFFRGGESSAIVSIIDILIDNL